MVWVFVWLPLTISRSFIATGLKNETNNSVGHGQSLAIELMIGCVLLVNRIFRSECFKPFEEGV